MSAERENEMGISALNRGNHHSACLEALKHFEQAAKIEPNHPKYATSAGVANQLFIQRWHAHIGNGPLVSIAIFRRGTPIYVAIDRQHDVLETVSEDDIRRLLARANLALSWYQRAIAVGYPLHLVEHGRRPRRDAASRADEHRPPVERRPRRTVAREAPAFWSPA